MPRFNSKHSGEVGFYYGRRSAEDRGHDVHTMLLSSEPITLGEEWTLKVEKTDDEFGYTVLGVTGCDPATLTNLPDEAIDLPQSRVLYGPLLFTDGKKTRECPRLCLSTGDTYGVSWAPGHVTFYRNGSVHYVWEVDTPDTPHIWGVVQMFLMKRVSVVEAAPRPAFLSPEPAAPEPCPLSVPVEERNDDMYPMTSLPRGYAIIINMSRAYGQEDRKGSEVDVRHLEELWIDLGFQVMTWVNKDAEDTVTDLKAVAGRSSLREHDCFVLVLMSHGKYGHIQAADGEMINLSKIYWTFSNAGCPNLMGTPKLFFIQSCRGDKKDEGTSREAKAITLPAITDMLVCYSSIAGYVSLRNTEQGSHFVQALTEVFRTYAKHADILKLMTKVIDRMIAKEGNNKQTPIFKSTLRRELRFP